MTILLGIHGIPLYVIWNVQWKRLLELLSKAGSCSPPNVVFFWLHSVCSHTLIRKEKKNHTHTFAMHRIASHTTTKCKILQFEESEKNEKKKRERHRKKKLSRTPFINGCFQYGTHTYRIISAVRLFGILLSLFFSTLSIIEFCSYFTIHCCFYFISNCCCWFFFSSSSSSIWFDLILVCRCIYYFCSRIHRHTA